MEEIYQYGSGSGFSRILGSISGFRIRDPKRQKMENCKFFMESWMLF
jgi:hypothetical protein